MKTTIESIKQALIEHNNWVVKFAETRNGTYEQIADNVWREKIHPFVKNEKIESWEKDIQKRFADNPYCRVKISEKQAYCLARAYAAINSETFEINEVAV